MPRILIRESKGKTDRAPSEYYAPDETLAFHTEFGAIPPDVLLKGGTHKLGGHRFTIYPATFPDRYARLRRGAQIITPKDLGLIITETGIGNESVILETGVGSGAVTAFLARIVKKIYAYDVDERAIKNSLNNLKELDVPKVYEIKRGDAYDAATIPHEEAIDVYVLDVPDPVKALPTAKKALKMGGWLIAYTPCITQVIQVVKALDDGWHHAKTCELLEREWKVKGVAVRPESRDFQHTAFLTFLRKVV